MKEPTQADYEAGRILHQAWYNVARAIAPPFDLIDKFDRLRWIETAKVSNAAQPAQEPDDMTIAYMSGLYEGRKLEREACAKMAEEWLGLTKDRELHIAAAIRARGNT